ncbi:MAG: hypothetical protein HFJ45_06190 [Clostridia bacterium]|nr:hypothetical protein [Clostridia bacterium]
MKKRKNGGSLFLIIIALIIIAIIAVIAISKITGDDGVITKVNKVEVEYSKAEVGEKLVAIVHGEVVKASEKISGTSNDISTVFNEKILISFLTGTLENEENPGIECLTVEPSATQIRTVLEDGEISNIYIINPKALSDKVDIYGKGKSLEDKDVFTLEAITEEITAEDGSIYTKSTGKFEIKYYDYEGKSSVIETVDLYLTNQS